MTTKASTAGLTKDAAGLTQRQRLFALEYLVDLNATQAAIRAGYAEASARITGVETLSKPAVAQLVQSALAKREAKTEINAARVLLELKRMALADLGDAFDAEGRLLPLKDMPEDVRRCIASIETEELFDGKGPDSVATGRIRKIKLWSKTDSAKMLAQHLGLLVERVEHSFATLTDVQRLERLAQILAAAEQRAGEDARVALDVTPSVTPAQASLPASGDPNASYGADHPADPSDTPSEDP